MASTHPRRPDDFKKAPRRPSGAARRALAREEASDIDYVEKTPQNASNALDASAPVSPVPQPEPTEAQTTQEGNHTMATDKNPTAAQATLEELTALKEKLEAQQTDADAESADKNSKTWAARAKELRNTSGTVKRSTALFGGFAAAILGTAAGAGGAIWYKNREANKAAGQSTGTMS